MIHIGVIWTEMDDSWSLVRFSGSPRTFMENRARNPNVLIARHLHGGFRLFLAANSQRETSGLRGSLSDPFKFLILRIGEALRTTIVNVLF